MAKLLELKEVKMDTVFIKMCDCPEIQGLRGKNKWQAWDYIYAANNYDSDKKEVLVVSGYETDSGYYGAMAGSKRYPDDECVPEDAIWLPTQSQLQKMVNTDFTLQILDLELLVEEGNWHYVDSMEQLWLAFVMKEKHGKVWNGEGWVGA